jgi:hypothetical protein
MRIIDATQGTTRILQPFLSLRWGLPFDRARF